MLLLIALGCRPGDPSKGDDTALDTAGQPCEEQTFWLDADGDGFGDEPVEACERPDGAVSAAGDCDDADPSVHPGAEEDCTEDLDRNCDGSTGYADEDGDGWPACEDCDDGSAAINPDADELCDLLDNDCDGETDEPDAVDARDFFADADGDSFGDPDTPLRACERPDGAVSDASDCDDADPAVHPGAEEICDAKDSDCDGEIGETLVPTDHATIQGAIDQAADGDAICVEPGTYTELVDFGGKGLTLEGAGGSAFVFLDAQGAGRNVLIGGAEGAALQGFTLQNGRASGTLGAAVLVEDSADITLRDLDVVGASAEGDDGGMIAVWGSSATVDRVSVHDCAGFNDSDTGYLLAPVHFYDSVFEITDLEVRDTSAEAVEIYGGALMTYLSEGSMSGVSLTDNSVNAEELIGGVMLVYGSPDASLGVTVEDLVVTGNEGYAGGVHWGSVLFQGLDELTLSGADISDNANEGAVGIYATLFITDGVEAVLENLALVGNKVEGGQVLAGALFNDQVETQASNLIVAGNDVDATSILYGMVLDFHPDGATSWTNATLHGNSSSVGSGGTQYSAAWTCIDVNTDLTNVSFSDNSSNGASSGALTALGLNGDCDADLRYGNAHDNDSPAFAGVSDPTGSDGNLDVDPGFSDVSSGDPLDWDLTLAAGSALIDAGDPVLSDADGSDCDIGAYGGPGAGDW